jgi:HK97 family phage major capsid protein
MILGYPVARMEDMPDKASNSFSIAFGNLKEAYTIVDRLGIRVLRDPFTAKPFVKFYTHKRTGGGVVNFEAIKLVKFGTA